MNLTTYFKLIYIFFSISFFSCDKVEVPKDVSSCISKRIYTEKRKCLSKVIEYDYNGSIVYLFIPSGCPDGYYNLYNQNCELICSPSGGISGQGDGKCKDFFRVAIEKRTIWEKR